MCSRSKQEVVALGIERQWRWMRVIKMCIEQERDGRLARLDMFAADVQRLSTQTRYNAAS